MEGHGFLVVVLIEFVLFRLIWQEEVLEATD